MAQSGSFGINPSKAYPETPAFPEVSLLQRGSNEKGKWVFAQANGSILQYAFCGILATGQAAELTTTTAGSVLILVGCPQIALADNEYGWFWIGEGGGDGKGIYGLAINYTAGDLLNTTATDGVADNASTTLIKNAVGLDTVGGTAAATELWATGIMQCN